MKTTSLLLAALTLIVYSCQPETETPEPFVKEAAELEQAAPGLTGEIVQILLDGELVDMERIGDLLIFEGDMVFDVEDFPGQLTTETVGYTTKKRWANSTIYYTIGSSASHRQSDIEWAANHITTKTNLTVQPRNGESNYVKFIKASGCSSAVGKQGGEQKIRVANWCGKGSIVHEILHAAGILHEHTRRDRNDYVTIKWENIQSGKSHNFNRAGSNFSDFTTGMNYKSIMMYSQKAFSKNGKKTIVRNDGKSYSTQRSGLSDKDIEGVNAMY